MELKIIVSSLPSNQALHALRGSGQRFIKKNWIPSAKMVLVQTNEHCSTEGLSQKDFSNFWVYILVMWLNVATFCKYKTAVHQNSWQKES